LLKNFVIRDSELGIFIVGGSPTISNVTIVDNVFGLAAYAGATPDISNCIFWNNADGDLFGDPDPIETKYSLVQEDVNEPTLAGLVSHWEFDEGTGSIAYDSASTNHGTIYGAAWTTGQIGGALDFDGVDDYVEIIDSDDSLDIEDNITIAAWVKLNDLNNVYFIVAKQPTGTSRTNYPGNYVFRTTPLDGYLQLYYQTGTGDKEISKNTSTSGIGAGAWNYVSVTLVEGGNVNFYINGSPAGTLPQEGVFGLINDEPVRIGTRKDGWSYFNGTIDDVYIYNRALSAGEIKQIYEHVACPLFADADNGDYHLLSERGRHWPEHDVWVLDKVTSPCVDGGEPTIDPSNEPMPNGGRINMGAYGNTAYASMNEWPIAEDNNRDGIVNMIDIAKVAARWLEKLDWVE